MNQKFRVLIKCGVWEHGQASLLNQTVQYYRLDVTPSLKRSKTSCEFLPFEGLSSGKQVKSNQISEEVEQGSLFQKDIKNLMWLKAHLTSYIIIT